MEHDLDNNMDKQELSEFHLEVNSMFEQEADHEAYYVYKSDQL